MGTLLPLPCLQVQPVILPAVQWKGQFQAVVEKNCFYQVKKKFKKGTPGSQKAYEKNLFLQQYGGTPSKFLFQAPKEGEHWGSPKGGGQTPPQGDNPIGTEGP